ncbi:MAG: diaminopimelate decarboxylase [Ruminococcaceae bacterium]|nr:diaminopimelate decarboxylase [Oscillospiraceae bacterium]
MFISDSLGVNESGHLTFGNHDTVELAGKYKTPVYIMDEVLIRKNCRNFVTSMNENYGGNGRVIYASKAFSCKAMYKIINEENMGIDVVSGGEIYTALKAGFPMEKAYFHGSNKSYDELVFAVNSGVGRIMVDNLYELELLKQISEELDTVVNVIVRVKPGIEAETHSFIMTGQTDSKFGLDLDTGDAMKAIKTALDAEKISFKGIHCHIGSQIFAVESFMHAAKVMVGIMKDIKDETGYEVEELDIGGGFGIRYAEEHKPAPFNEYMKKVSVVIKEECEKAGLKTPFVIIEPGRSIVAEAGITLYTVGAIKTIPDVRTYVSVDGGMCDNPRYILYQSKYTAIIANKANEKADFLATIAGKCCESGDMIQEHTYIQKPESGDIMAVLSTGAYNYSMSSNYNRNPRPAVVMLNGDEERIVVKAETYEDLIRNDM